MTVKLISALIITVLCGFSYESPVAKPENIRLRDAYDDCFDKVARCFGMPKDCVNSRNCDVLMKATPCATQCGGADFELIWKINLTSGDHWAAGGLSVDDKMGDDSVTECILKDDNKTVTARQGLTFHNESGEPHYGVVTVEPVQGITNEQGIYTDGIVSCTWKRSQNTTVRSNFFDIFDDPYYILMAHGPMKGGS